jgi:hypothetical protein
VGPAIGGGGIIGAQAGAGAAQRVRQQPADTTVRAARTANMTYFILKISFPQDVPVSPKGQKANWSPSSQQARLRSKRETSPYCYLRESNLLRYAVKGKMVYYETFLSSWFPFDINYFK